MVQNKCIIFEEYICIHDFIFVVCCCHGVVVGCCHGATLPQHLATGKTLFWIPRMRGVTLLHLLHRFQTFFFSMSYVHTLHKRHDFSNSLDSGVTAQRG